MATAKVQLIFNKITGAYLGSMLFIGTDQQTELLSGKQHEAMSTLLVDMDVETEIWEGDITTGKIIPISEKQPEVTEYMLDAGAKNKIFRKYKYYHQVNIMADMIELLMAKLSFTPDEQAEFDAMRTYIAKIKANNERYKTAYQASTDYKYIDKAEYFRKMNAELEGGLQEVVGRPPYKVETPWENDEE